MRARGTPGIHLLGAQWPSLGRDLSGRDMATVMFQAPRRGELRGSAPASAGQPACSVAGRTAPTRARSRNLPPAWKRASLSGLSITLSLPTGRTDLCFSTPSPPVLGSPPDSLFPAADLTQKGDGVGVGVGCCYARTRIMVASCNSLPTSWF